MTAPTPPMPILRGCCNSYRGAPHVDCAALRDALADPAPSPTPPARDSGRDAEVQYADRLAAAGLAGLPEPLTDELELAIARAKQWAAATYVPGRTDAVATLAVCSGCRGPVHRPVWQGPLLRLLPWEHLEAAHGCPLPDLYDDRRPT